MTATLDIELPLLDIRVDPLSYAELEGIVTRALNQHQRVVIGNHNMHSVYLAAVDDEFHKSCGSFDYRLIDGFPILVLASWVARRWLGTGRRLGSLDWVPQLVDSGTLRRIAVVGSTEVSNQGAVEELRRRAPSADVRGWSGVAWEAGRAREVAVALHDYQPDFVIVGLGMPLQEAFVASDLMQLPTVIATVGGAIDQLSGHQSPAPRWLGRFGIEWLWRFAKQPRRLAFRYLIEPILLVRAIRCRSGSVLHVQQRS